MPTLIAVVFALPWIIIDAKVRNLEPFYQLVKPDGGRTSTTLCMDYSSPVSFFAPAKAIFSGQWGPLLTSLLSTCTIFLTPLAPEFVSIRLAGQCDSNTTGCVPSIGVLRPVGRAVQALLCVMVVLAVLLIIHMYQYTTGVLANPLSIAGQATLLHNPEVLSHLRRSMLFGSTEKQILQSISFYRYKIGFYTNPGGSKDYGYLSASPTLYSIAPYTEVPPIIPYDTNMNPRSQTMEYRYPHLKGAIGLLLMLLGLLVLIIYYKSPYSPNTGFERFMDSQGFGVSFLFTSVGVIIKLYWDGVFKSKLSSCLCVLSLRNPKYLRSNMLT